MIMIYNNIPLLSDNLCNNLEGGYNNVCKIYALAYDNICNNFGYGFSDESSFKTPYYIIKDFGDLFHSTDLLCRLKPNISNSFVSRAYVSFTNLIEVSRNTGNEETNLFDRYIYGAYENL